MNNTFLTTVKHKQFRAVRLHVLENGAYCVFGLEVCEILTWVHRRALMLHEQFPLPTADCSYASPPTAWARPAGSKGPLLLYVGWPENHIIYENNWSFRCVMTCFSTEFFCSSWNKKWKQICLTTTAAAGKCVACQLDKNGFICL